jgi:hypothetical protein
MASPFTAEIIPLPLLGAKQEPGAPPRSAPVATRRYLRHLDADDIARLLDGTDYGEPEVVRRQREFRPRRISLSAVVFCLLTWGVIGGCFVLIASGRL